MHRIERLNVLVKEWLDLGLTETCSRADAHNRIQIKHKAKPGELTFTGSRQNKVWLTIGLTANAGPVAFTTGYPEAEEHRVIGQAIWALEFAIENY